MKWRENIEWKWAWRRIGEMAYAGGVMCVWRHNLALQ
jgi:hypothetical protein